MFKVQKNLLFLFKIQVFFKFVYPSGIAWSTGHRYVTVLRVTSWQHHNGFFNPLDRKKLTFAAACCLSWSLANRRTSIGFDVQSSPSTIIYVQSINSPLNETKWTSNIHMTREKCVIKSEKEGEKTLENEKCP